MTVQELLEISRDLGKFVIYDKATGKNIYNSDFGKCKIKSYEPDGNDKKLTCWYINSKVGEDGLEKQDVIFTPDDIDALFKFGEQIEEIHDNISKNSSVLAILAEGIASASREGIPFTSDTVLNAIETIRDYIYKVEEISSHLNEEYHKLYSEKRNICYGEERVAA